ncbi:MAG: 2-deoxy-D-gluconate 3-dehydrogenase [Terriglobia bacterium]|nr:MAG: 2-deoxy-D-gluconate 3-dehydrogenase [Terriglobia bacterium]
MGSTLDLSGRVAVVIGGTSGLGRAIAIGLAEAGADVVATGRREELAASASREIEALGRRSLTATVDVLERHSVDSLRDRVLERFGHMEILVYAAGAVARRPSLDVTEAEWAAALDVNATGALRACQSFYDALAASRQGRVIHIASLNSFVSLTQVAAYAAAKSALLSLTRSLAVEWAASGVNVNAIAPGVFRTDLNSKLLDETERGRELLMRTPMRRFGCPEELVGAAVLLASDAASFITGQCLVVDGGFLASGVNT